MAMGKSGAGSHEGLHMRVVFELYTHWVTYGRPGGTQLDFDVNRGTTLLGRFDSREAAEREARRRDKESEDRTLGTSVDEEFDCYEIKEIHVPDADESGERSGSKE